MRATSAWRRCFPPTWNAACSSTPYRPAVARPIARHDDLPAASDQSEPASAPWRGRSVAVTGSGGIGRSTLAMALAAGLAADPRDAGLVVLTDLALHAEQALLHDAGDVVPGVVELVDAYRGTALDVTGVRGHVLFGARPRLRRVARPAAPP